jgi:hypothetical protein
MVQARDPLELLLPDASEATLRRGRSVVQFLRLIANDAVSTRAAVVGLGLDEARCQLEAHDRAGMESALCDLLRHHLRVLSTPGSFLALGEAGLPYDAAWRVLDELREVEPRIPPLYWQTDAQPSAMYTAFVHVLDADGVTITQVDQWPGGRPSDTWADGEVIVDTYAIPLPENATPVQLAIGLYTAENGLRLPITDAAGNAYPDNRYLVPVPK